jgi:hypothetical protein
MMARRRIKQKSRALVSAAERVCAGYALAAGALTLVLVLALVFLRFR